MGECTFIKQLWLCDFQIFAHVLNNGKSQMSFVIEEFQILHITNEMLSIKFKK